MFDLTEPSSPAYYSAEQTALLLLDFHSAIISKHRECGTEAALQQVVKFRTWAKSQHIAVIHCLIDLDADPFPTCKDGARLKLIVQEMKQEGAAEPEELTRGAGSDEPTFTRRPGHVSALRSPGLLEYLEQHKINSLILTGISTSACVARTAIAAADLEYVTTVLTDCAADPSPGAHDFVISRMLSRGHAMTAAEFEAGFEQSQAKR